MLSHYRLIERIGEGGMGVVWKAVDTKLDREVAIKILPEDCSRDPERLGRFKREAKTIAALDHPNIVTVHAVEETEGVHFITMELVRGKPLTELIPRNGLALEKFFDLAVALADAISTAHEQGITHRDVKPDNVMVGDNGRLKVLDFGLAKLREEPRTVDGTQFPTATVTQEGKILGTVSYMSPEQAEGKPIDHRSDIFSLGVMLYQMATGQRPFKGETSVSIISSILKDTPPPITDLEPRRPRQLERIIRRCLAKDPVERFQSAVGLRSELEALKRELDSEATIASEIRPGVGSWWIWAAVVVVLSVLGMIFGPRLLRSPDEVTASSSVPDRAMIVVLPFENLGSADEEYFAAGMTDEITSRLAVVSGLGVISRTSTLQYDRTGKSIKQVGQDFGVDYVLEGTVRWARGAEGPSRVRITPQLIRVSDDTHLWAEAYDEVIEDIFEVQSQIAAKVIEQLGVALLEPEHRALASKPTDHPGAYQAYLRGLYHARNPDTTEENYRLAVQMFERAVELDPGFALAHAELSKMHSAHYHFGYDRTEARLALAKQAVDRALELAPEAPEAHFAMGDYHYWGHKDYARALAEFAIAAEGLPNSADLLLHIAAVYRRQGRWDEAVANLEKAMELNPLDSIISFTLGQTLFRLRRYADAERYCDRSISVVPDQANAYTWKAEVYWRWKGTTEESRVTLEAMPETDDPNALWAWFWHEIYEGEYQEALDRLFASSVEAVGNDEFFFPKPLLMAHAYGLLNKPQLARSAYDSARIVLETEIRARPDDFRLHSALGIALAGLSRKDEAIQEGKRAVEQYPVSKDAFAGTRPVSNLALIYTMVGEHDAALDQIAYLLSIPSRVSVPLLRLDPRWAPLRDHPRFKELARRFG